jgi:1,4-alpha-glucan branching enzyme
VNAAVSRHAVNAASKPDARPYLFLGAHAAADGHGVHFTVWAPHAQSVSVVGDFNGWNGRLHPMQRRDPVASQGDRLDAWYGVWTVHVPQASLGQHYKFELHNSAGHLLPLKADPFARAAQLRPATASTIAPMPARRTLPSGRAQANRRDAAIAIFEVHAGSWRRHADGSFLTWDELAEQLPAYVSGLGFTHVELLPITEHPFDGSWGYQALGQFAPTARFGPPEGFARLVAACHAHGLGVLLDWVPGHFPSDAHGLAQFDGTPTFEYADSREGYHHDWDTLIYDYARTEVRSFLKASALYWLEHYGVDGLRVDAVASMLYRDYSRPADAWLPNIHGGRENLEVISLLRELNTLIGADVPGAITVAEESTAFPGVSAPVDHGGLGFHYKWNMGWMNDTLAYMQEDPVHRRYHHDKMRFGLIYAFSENFVLPLSHDEVVHGKGSVLSKMPGDDWQQFANLRSYYGFMWGHPGKKLLFMGQEWGQRSEWNAAHALPWHEAEAPAHAGIANLVRALNALIRSQPPLHQRDAEASGFEWLVHDDADQSVFVWLRRDAQGREVLVACNFTPVPRHGYRVGLPEASAAAWHTLLNTDDARFGGSGQHNAGPLHAEAVPHHGHARSLLLTLPPLATVFLGLA